MNRFDARTVELEPAELIASAHHADMLDMGHGVVAAGSLLRYQRFSSDFIEWLLGLEVQGR